MPPVCQRCGRELQDADKACPDCGLPRYGEKHKYPPRSQYHASAKKDKTLLPMLAVIAVVAVISIVGMYFTSSDSRAYSEAMEYYNSGDYGGAITAFTEIGDYGQSTEMIRKSYYERANERFIESDFTGAIEDYGLSDGYADSGDMIRQCRYQAGMQYIEAEDWQSAADALQDINVEDSEELYTFAAQRLATPQMADDEFLQSLSAGLNERWSDDADEYSMNASELKTYYSRLVGYETDRLYGYENRDFADERLSELAVDYIKALRVQEKALDYLNVDEDRYADLWGRGYDARAVALYEIATGYSLDVENMDALNEIVAGAPMAWIQTQSAKHMDELLDSVNFEQVKNVYGWKTYEAETQNTTGKNIGVIWLHIDLLDEEENLVDSVSCSVENWQNGQTATFDFITDVDFHDMDVTADWG